MRRALLFNNCGGLQSTELRDVPIPSPGRRAVLVRVHAAGLNPTDINICQGRLILLFPDPSRPSYGRTPLEAGSGAAEAATALVALLDSLQIQTCALVAISGGGPTGVALSAGYPPRITQLVLAAAITHPEDRPNEPSYKSQATFYGPMHNLKWGMLGLMSRLSPRAMARQTLAIFSTHDPDDGLSKLSPENIAQICRFYQGRSSRQGALADNSHKVGADLLRSIHQPTLVIHSREDNSVPFGQAEWSLQHIPQAELCEAGITGHFFWVDPEYPRICQRLIAFLRNG
jgi:pimeloyl-ACP methyl ester carboxylesterase